MFVPILHERMVVSRWPWVSLALILACFAVFGLTATSAADDESQELFARAVAFALSFPETEVDPRLLTPELAERVRTDAPEEIAAAREAIGDVSLADAQAELDRLTADWLTSLDRSPTWRFGLVPARLRAPALVTHQFLHGDLLHLLGNLLMLYLTAPLVEDRIGRGRFAAAYLGLGVLAGLAYALHFPNLFRPLIGASGAISGVVGMFVVLYAGLKLRYLLWIGLPLGMFSAPAWVMFPVWFLMQIALGLGASSSTEAGLGGVAYWAHAWGFVGGVGAGFLLRRSSPAIEIAAADPLDETRKLLALGRREQAWDKLLRAVRTGADSDEAIRELWQLARLIGRSSEAAPAFTRMVRRSLRAGDASSTHRAAQLWHELKSALKSTPVDPALSFEIAAALEKLGESRDERELMIVDALEGLRPATPLPVVEGLARLASSARSAEPRTVLDAVRARTDLPPALVEALARGVAASEQEALR